MSEFFKELRDLFIKYDASVRVNYEGTTIPDMDNALELTSITGTHIETVCFTALEGITADELTLYLESQGADETTLTT